MPNKEKPQDPKDPHGPKPEDTPPDGPIPPKQ